MLNEITKYFSKAKRVALLAFDTHTKKWFHIFSVIELLPDEILEYTIPTQEWYNNKTVRSKFSSVSDLYTFSLIVDDLAIQDAIDIFNSPFQNNIIDNETNYYYNKTFIKEPSGEVPLILKSNIFKIDGLGSILPKRNSGLYVWSQIDKERIVEKMFRSETISKEMKSMSELTNKWLGFDIWFSPEHIGNIYLTAPNPYFRSIDTSLSQNPTGIFYNLKLRKGVNERFKIRITDTHGDNIALDKVCEITNPIGLIELPHEPQLVEYRVYNSNNDLIYIDGPSAFIKNINFEMNMKQADFHVKVEDIKENREFTIEKYSKGGTVNIGNPHNFNAPYYFKNAESTRKHIENRKNVDFIFFKSPKSDINEINRQKAEAKNLIRDLINKAKYKCYICDPYFDERDLIEYAFYIQNTSVELKIMNSTEGTNKEKAKLLLQYIQQYNEKPFQKIELRVLMGNILHDRFVVADNDVWFVGTSLNQIGSKATCIAKVPESDNFEIIKEVEKWYLNIGFNYSQSLTEYANITAN